MTNTHALKGDAFTNVVSLRQDFNDASACALWISLNLRRGGLGIAAAVPAEQPDSSGQEYPANECFYRIAFYERAAFAGQDSGSMPAHEEQFSFSAKQAGHLREVFSGLNFKVKEYELWETEDFDATPSCREIIIKNNGPESVNVTIHGLTMDMIRANYEVLHKGITTIPKPIPA